MAKKPSRERLTEADLVEFGVRKHAARMQTAMRKSGFKNSHCKAIATAWRHFMAANYQLSCAELALAGEYNAKESRRIIGTMRQVSKELNGMGFGAGSSP